MCKIINALFRITSSDLIASDVFLDVGARNDSIQVWEITAPLGSSWSGVRQRIAEGLVMHSEHIREIAGKTKVVLHLCVDASDDAFLTMPIDFIRLISSFPIEIEIHLVSRCGRKKPSRRIIS